MLLKKAAFVLDVGCGIGRISTPCAKKVARVVGVDISVSGIRFAQQHERRSNCDFLVADAEHLPFRDDIFDLVLFFGIFEYVDGMMMRRILKESLRVSRFGGRTLLNTWNKHGLKFRTLITLPLRLRRSSHSKWKFSRHEYSLKELIETTSGCGYEAEQYSGHFFIAPSDIMSLKKIFKTKTVSLLRFLCRFNGRVTTSVIGSYISINLMTKMKKAKKEKCVFD